MPMPGTNVLQVCEATMVEMVQHYLDSIHCREGQAPKVEGVTCQAAGGANVFQIKTTSEKR